MSLVPTIVAFALSLFPVRAALGQEAPPARRAAPSPPSAEFGKDYFQRAVSLFDAGEFEESARYFRMAYAVRGNFKMLYNLAQAEMSAKRYGLAMEAFETYLLRGAREISPSRKAEVQGEMELLEQMVGTVSVSAAPGYEVRINDVFRGKTPLARGLYVKAEFTHVVEIWGQGGRVFRQTVALNAGQSVEVDASSSIEETAVPVDADPVGATATAPSLADPISRNRDLEKHVSRELAFRDLAVVAAVPGVVLSVTGGLLFLDRDLSPHPELTLSLGAVALSGSLLGIVGRRHQRSRAERLGGVPVLSLETRKRIVERNIYKNKTLGIVLLTAGTSVSLGGALLLGLGTQRGEDSLKHWGGALLPSGIAYVMGSIPLFILSAVDRRRWASTGERDLAESLPLSMMPVMFPQPRGGGLGFVGVF